MAWSRLWHKLDATFRLPRTNSYWRLASPLTYDSARSAALSHLLLKLLEDALCETAYLADVAGLHYKTWFEGRQGACVLGRGTKSADMVLGKAGCGAWLHKKRLAKRKPDRVVGRMVELERLIGEAFPRLIAAGCSISKNGN